MFCYSFVVLSMKGFAYASFYRDFVPSYGAWRFCSGVNAMNNLQKAISQYPMLIELAESYLATATDTNEIEKLNWWIQYFQEQQQQQIMESK